MDLKELQSILTIGETVAVEFKRCGNGIENDTYETVCSFLNRFGGDLFMGVLDDGSVLGVPEKAASAELLYIFFVSINIGGDLCRKKGVYICLQVYYQLQFLGWKYALCR